MLISALNKMKMRRRTPAARFAARVALFNLAAFLVAGAYLPYMPLWLGSRGLNEAQIGVVMATPLLVRVGITPVISAFADRSGDFRATLRALCVGTLLALAALAFTRSFQEILLCLTVYAISWTTIIPLSEALAMRGVRENGCHYGRMRLWGSLSFIVASLLCGAAVERWGAGAALPFLIAAAFALTAASTLLPGDETGRPPRLARFAPPPEESAGRPPATARARQGEDGVLRSAAFWLFLIAASAVQSAHGFYYAFGSIHWQSQQISGSMIGALWTLGVIAEIALFAWSDRLLVHFHPARLILLGALAAAVRWTAMAFDPPLATLAVLQLLHAFTFGATHLGAVHFISETVPRRYAATAQGLYAAAASGAALGAVTLASGPLYRSFGGAGYGAMALLACLSTAAALRLDALRRRRLPPPSEGR